MGRLHGETTAQAAPNHPRHRSQLGRGSERRLGPRVAIEVGDDIGAGGHVTFWKPVLFSVELPEFCKVRDIALTFPNHESAFVDDSRSAHRLARGAASETVVIAAKE